MRNALRVSTEGQVVEVTVARDPAAGRFRVEVADDGPGLPEESLSSIFEPFVRGPENTGPKGFGLGLAIARRLVHAHGGTIEARNRPAGGLLVTVSLPIPAGAALQGAGGQRRLAERIGLCRAG